MPHPITWIPSIEETPQSEADYFKPSPSAWDVVDPMLQRFVEQLHEMDRKAAERTALPPQPFAGTSYRYVEYFDTPRPPGYTLDDLTALREQKWRTNPISISAEAVYNTRVYDYEDSYLSYVGLTTKRVVDSLNKAMDLAILLGDPGPGNRWVHIPDNIILGEN
jgi:hypothetical protein